MVKKVLDDVVKNCIESKARFVECFLNDKKDPYCKHRGKKVEFPFPNLGYQGRGIYPCMKKYEKMN